MQHEPTHAEIIKSIDDLRDELWPVVEDTNNKFERMMQFMQNQFTFMHNEFAAIHDTLRDHTQRLGRIEDRVDIMEGALDTALIQLVNHDGRIGRLELKTA